MRATGWITKLGLYCLAILVFCTSAWADRQTVIDDGCSWLYSQRLPNSSWDNNTGHTAVHTLALLEHDYDVNLSSSINYLLNNMDQAGAVFDPCGCSTASTAGTLLCLAYLGDYTYADEMILMQSWLLSMQIDEDYAYGPVNPGGYGYGAFSLGPYYQPRLTATFWALKAIKDADYYLGTDITTAVALRTANNFLESTRQADGGHNDEPPYVSNPQDTAAALAIYLLAGVNDSRVADCIDWLDDHFEVLFDPQWDDDMSSEARFAAVLGMALNMAGIDYLAGNDWRALIDYEAELNQNANGSWEEPQAVYDGPGWESGWALLALDNDGSEGDYDLTIDVLAPGGDLHIVDSFNRHVGFNEATGLLETNIPNSSFSVLDQEDISYPYDGTTPAYPLRQVIEINNPLPGYYLVVLLGTGDEDYDFAATLNGEWMTGDYYSSATQYGAVEIGWLWVDYSYGRPDVFYEPFFDSDGILNVYPGVYDFTVTPGQTLQFNFDISEASHYGGLTDVSVAATDIISDETSQTIISGEDFSFSAYDVYDPCYTDPCNPSFEYDPCDVFDPNEFFGPSFFPEPPGLLQLNSSDYTGGAGYGFTPAALGDLSGFDMPSGAWVYAQAEVDIPSDFNGTASGYISVMTANGQEQNIYLSFETQDVAIEAYPAQVEAAKEGGIYSIAIQGPDDTAWQAQIVQGATWFGFYESTNQGVVGDDLYLEILPNNDTLIRTGKISIWPVDSPSNIITVNIVQGGVFFGVSPYNVPVAADGGEFSISIIGPTEFTLNWQASINTGHDWLTFVDPNSGTTNATLRVSATANPSNSERSGSLFIQGMDEHGGKSNHLVTISQAGQPAIPTYTLTAVANPSHGSVTGAGQYQEGAVATVQAVAQPGYLFSRWLGTDDDTNTSTTNTVTMNGNRSVTALFVIDPTPAYTLTVSVIGSGTVTPSSSIFEEGTVVTLTAAADAYHEFEGWTGTDNDATLATTNSVTMNGNRTVVARFKPMTCQLTTSVAAGEGTITPPSGLINCGRIVALQAHPAPGYKVKAWHGTDNDNLTSSVNTVLMTTDHAVSVEFELIEVPMVTLTTQVIGDGSCSPETLTVPQGTVVLLNATPEANNELSQWSGTDDDSSTDVINAVTMDSDKTVTVTFASTLVTLTTQVNGVGTIAPETTTVPRGTTVSLTATPGANETLTSWSGTDDDSSVALTNTVTMDSDKTVTATFATVQVLLSYSISAGQGSVPATSGTYDQGQVVALSVTPDPGFRVRAWHGTDNDSSTGTSNKVTMAASKTVTVELVAEAQSIKVKANDGKKDFTDSLKLSADFFATEEQIADANDIKIRIWSDTGFNYQPNPLPFSFDQLRNGRFSYVGPAYSDETGKLKLGFNLRTDVLDLDLAKVDLQGLGSPFYLEVIIGEYVCWVEVVDGQAIPVTFLEDVADTFRVDNSKFRIRKKEQDDSLRFNGAISLAESVPNLAETEMTIVWGDVTYVIGAGAFVEKQTGRFVCNKVLLGDGPTLATAVFDFNKSIYSVRFDKTVVEIPTESFELRMAFGDFDQTVQMHCSKSDSNVF